MIFSVSSRRAFEGSTRSERTLSTFRELSGVAAPVRARAGSGKGKAEFAEAALFTHKGLSGPSMLQVSSYWRHGEAIASSFAESTVNQVVSNRMVKKQQMRWTELGAHRLLQVRARVLDQDLRARFRGWYPGMRPDPEPAAEEAA